MSEVAEGRKGSGLAVLFAALAGFGLLGAGAVFTKCVFAHLEGLTLFSGSIRPEQMFGIMFTGIEEFGSFFARFTAVAGAWLGVLAVVQALVEVIPRQSPDAQPSEARGDAGGRSKRAAALFFAVACFGAAAFAYLGLERKRLWTEWAAMAPVALAALFGALRAHSRVRPPRLPGALLPITLAASALLFSAADTALRWYTAALYLQYYGDDRPLPEESVSKVRANRPIGALVPVTPVLVLVAFGAWSWAEGKRRGPAPKSRAPAVLAVGTVVMLIAYAGLDRRIRKDITVHTGGTGSIEDFIAFARETHSPYADPKRSPEPSP